MTSSLFSAKIRGEERKTSKLLCQRDVKASMARALRTTNEGDAKNNVD